jgi:hypothetical protein
MNDTTTQKPLQVLNYANTGKGGTIIVPMDILDKVKTVLDANKVFYWVDEEALSIDDGPEVTFITLSQKCDPNKVQQILDSVP